MAQWAFNDRWIVDQTGGVMQLLVTMHLRAGELGGRFDVLLRLPAGLLAIRLTAALDTVIAAPWDHIAGAQHPPNHAGTNR
jgi:hypothetical protein